MVEVSTVRERIRVDGESKNCERGGFWLMLEVSTVRGED